LSVIGAKGRIRPASGESEKQHQRNEDRRNAENEDEPVHGIRMQIVAGRHAFAGMRMGRATDKGDEFPPPHAAPKAKDHNLIITPRIAAREADYPVFAPEKSD
jgi:hypothetical protein